MRILDIGPGNDRQPDATEAMDANPMHLQEGDIVHDLDVLPLPYESGTFDKVYALDIIEHTTTNTISILCEIRRILKYRGTLVLTVPNFKQWNYRLLFLTGNLPPDFFKAHKKHFTKDYIIGCLYEAGFKVKYRKSRRVFLPEGFRRLVITATRFE